MSSVIAASAGRVVLRVKATTVAQLGSPGPTLERMNVRMTLTGGCAMALLSATFGISAASPTSPGPKRDRATQMFARKEFSRAIDRLKDHARGLVRLLDVALSTTTADFLYETNGRQVNFKVAVHGTRVAKGRSIVAGGRAFGLCRSCTQASHRDSSDRSGSDRAFGGSFPRSSIWARCSAAARNGR